jgi:hypothetical protein
MQTIQIDETCFGMGDAKEKAGMRAGFVRLRGAV